MKLNEATIGEYNVSYRNERIFKQIYKEIFVDDEYFFKTKNSSPVIIDGGAHIGLAALYFKRQYQKAKIVCFEANPQNYIILKNNISKNKLENVECFNKALAKTEGYIELYGQIHGEAPDTSGNSIVKNMWGTFGLGVYDDVIKVHSVPLSKYITTPIDFLKLDIEGAEQQVLEEIENKMHLISQMIIEYHGTQTGKYINDLDEIIRLLESRNFNISLFEKTIEDLLPENESIKQQVQNNLPKIVIIKAIRNE